MTNEELFADLKQYIAATISQQTAHLATKEDVASLDDRMIGLEDRMGGLERQVNRLERHLDEQLAGIADTLTQAVAALDVTEELQDHERRLVRLEHRAV